MSLDIKRGGWTSSLIPVYSEGGCLESYTQQGKENGIHLFLLLNLLGLKPLIS